MGLGRDRGRKWQIAGEGNDSAEALGPAKSGEQRERSALRKASHDYFSGGDSPITHLGYDVANGLLRGADSGLILGGHFIQ